MNALAEWIDMPTMTANFIVAESESYQCQLHWILSPQAVRCTNLLVSKSNIGASIWFPHIGESPYRGAPFIWFFVVLWFTELHHKCTISRVLLLLTKIMNFKVIWDFDYKILEGPTSFSLTQSSITFIPSTSTQLYLVNMNTSEQRNRSKELFEKHIRSMYETRSSSTSLMKREKMLRIKKFL